ncbi:hypothetical protein [Paraburkholderia kururiensis]|uniref:Lipoprotein n=1 Tax=Paraburkholderia kururiensis TaxID=984307 RepID=A0ABZ0WJQ4_9BURK|nr:hypothetical protein [Paraburkholderia kururiensis]WQD77569.1 hypothetical protein U0042_26565 [Paraburkholderia kururiensis]
MRQRIGNIDRLFALSRSIVKSIKLTSVASAVLALSVAACGSSTPSLSGSAWMGAVANATVAVYPLNPDGSAAHEPLATTTTASDGSFSLWQTLRYPVLVRVTGGRYEEEATGASADLSGEVDAVYLSTPARMVVSPWSNAVVADAVSAGGLTAGNVTAALSRVNAFAGNIDVQQTLPTFVTAGAAAAMTPGAVMALALGAESQSRTSAGLSIADSTANIVAQAANGDTLAECNAGAGDVAADGTLGAPATANCALTVGAADYVAGAHNRSGITSISALTAVVPGKPAAVTVSSAACHDRIALLAEQFGLFASRKNDVQALLGNGVTAANWASYANGGTWGPHAAVYGAITTASCNDDVATFQRELVMAVENYWVDQGINYCHHHIPGWLPPVSPAKFRNSTSGSTSGGDSSGMTCTANRRSDGSQSLTAVAHDDVNWQGVDCSDFTSWVYDFAGVTHDTGNLETGIGTQACSTGGDPLVGKEQAGVLLDINQGNIASLVDHLRPGDLLYITQTAPQAADATPSNIANGYIVSHVITWTGKHFSDLRNGPDGSLYDPATAGQRGSRLGADIASYLKSTAPGQKVLPSDLGSAGKDPWMIIDSHFAGPAYRPFVIPTASMKADWYVQNLSHVRRIIDADSARTDPVLAPLVIGQVSTTDGDFGKVVTFSSPQSRTSAGGYKLIYQRPKKNAIPTCYRVGTAAAAQ